MEEFDEAKAIAYMRENSGVTAEYDDDQLLNIIDIIWDFYEQNGMLDLSFDDDSNDDLDMEALMKYVRKMTAKDRGCIIAADDLEPLVRAELAYEASLEE